MTSLDDPALREAKVGVHLIGDDGFNTPPAHALSRRGIVENVRGYSIYGDYAKPNPPARIVEAVASGEIDVAVVWGPLAGYFAPRQNGAAASRAGDAAGRRAAPADDLRHRDGRAHARTRLSGRRSMRSSPAADLRSMPFLAAYGVPRADPPTRVGAVQ